MRPLIFFGIVFLVSITALALAILYLSPTLNSDQYDFKNIAIFSFSLLATLFSAFTLILFLLNRLFRRIFRKNAAVEQKHQLRRVFRTSMRRGLLTSILITSIVLLRIFEIDTRVNLILLIAIVGLTEILFWRYT